MPNYVCTMHTKQETYTIWLLKNPLYLFCNAVGKSKWKSVANGEMPSLS